MRYLNLILSLTLILSLCGCAALRKDTLNSRTNYDRQANTIPATKLPKDLSKSQSSMQSYYPIPPVAMGSMAPHQPSLIPPGSQAAHQLALQQVSQPHQTTIAGFSNSSLVLSLDYNKAWPEVGRALHASGYKVMQQDKSMGAYYILDLASTGGVLKTSTPIYQVHMTASGTNSTVQLLDDKNKPASSAVASRVLGALKNKL